MCKYIYKSDIEGWRVQIWTLNGGGVCVRPQAETVMFLSFKM